VAGPLQVLAEPGAAAAGAFDPEDEPMLLLVHALRPALQFNVAGRGRRKRELAEQLPERVERHRAMAVLVGVDPECDHRSLLIVWNGPGDVEAAGQSSVE
jgi:hypothetical protein